jgi:hypothetical protein
MRQAQPVRDKYKIPLIAVRTLVVRGRPPGLGGGIIGSINFHWASVRLLGYPFLFMYDYIGQTGTFNTRS